MTDIRNKEADQVENWPAKEQHDVVGVTAAPIN